MIATLAALALAVAVSPFPVAAVLLILVSSRSRAPGVGYLLGWVVGIVAPLSAATMLSTVLAAALPRTGGAPSPVVAAIGIALGVVLIVLGLLTWARRHRGGQAATPAWMSKVESLTSRRAGVLGLGLALTNPKNLAAAATGGLALGGSVSVGATLVAAAGYLTVAASTVAVPVVIHVLMRDRIRERLDTWREWLRTHDRTILAVVLLLLGVGLTLRGVLGL